MMTGLQPYQCCVVFPSLFDLSNGHMPWQHLTFQLSELGVREGGDHKWGELVQERSLVRSESVC